MLAFMAQLKSTEILSWTYLWFIFASYVFHSPVTDWRDKTKNGGRKRIEKKGRKKGRGWRRREGREKVEKKGLSFDTKSSCSCMPFLPTFLELNNYSQFKLQKQINNKS